MENIILDMYGINGIKEQELFDTFEDLKYHLDENDIDECIAMDNCTFTLDGNDIYCGGYDLDYLISMQDMYNEDEYKLLAIAETEGLKRVGDYFGDSRLYRNMDMIDIAEDFIDNCYPKNREIELLLRYFDYKAFANDMKTNCKFIDTSYGILELY